VDFDDAFARRAIRPYASFIRLRPFHRRLGDAPDRLPVAQSGGRKQIATVTP
jgi:hypothetical protein